LGCISADERHASSSQSVHVGRHDGRFPGIDGLRQQRSDDPAENIARPSGGQPDITRAVDGAARRRPAGGNHGPRTFQGDDSVGSELACGFHAGRQAINRRSPSHADKLTVVGSQDCGCGTGGNPIPVQRVCSEGVGVDDQRSIAAQEPLDNSVGPRSLTHPRSNNNCSESAEHGLDGGKGTLTIERTLKGADRSNHQVRTIGNRK
jgi:hypothetical protein